MKLTGAGKIRSEALMLHTVFILAVICLLISGIHYYFAFIQQRLLLTVFCCSFLLLCIYAGRWLCQCWYLQQKPFHFSMYAVLMLMAMVIVWPLAAKMIFNAPGVL